MITIRGGCLETRFLKSQSRLSLLIPKSSFGKASLRVRQKHDWGRGFILLLTQTVVLPGTNAGSVGVKPASKPKSRLGLESLRLKSRTRHCSDVDNFTKNRLFLR